ncbi:hypothetical protein [uncultured Clostridium sp.]|uniref:hypothetical protein n=1 Tax=uncultured Clostridium sp. TaxID=59620 RepID=UPI00262E5469|nr:hypothetical protein [uncultured Clostridium sp.]
MVKEKTTFSFPEMFDLDTGKTKMISGLKATNSNIGLLLRTSVFEIFGDPSTGSRLREYLFAPNMDLVRDIIREHITNVLEKKQTDIQVIFLDVFSYNGDENTVHIQIDYKDLNTGQICKNTSRIDVEELREKVN